MRLPGIQRAAAAVIVIASIAAIAIGSLSEARTAAPAPVIDGQGNLRVPDRYRTRYEALGAWAVRTGATAAVAQMHVVYASPGTIEHFRTLGHFPNGTVLIKEVWDANTAPMTTGTVSHPDRLKGWFVMVKESRNLHPANKMWGDGWAWSWFDADNPSKTTSTDYMKDCKGCHVPAKSTDWIYVNGYPALRGH